MKKTVYIKNAGKIDRLALFSFFSNSAPHKSRRSRRKGRTCPSREFETKVSNTCLMWGSRRTSFKKWVGRRRRLNNKRPGHGWLQFKVFMEMTAKIPFTGTLLFFLFATPEQEVRFIFNLEGNIPRTVQKGRRATTEGTLLLDISITVSHGECCLFAAVEHIREKSLLVPQTQKWCS